MREIKYCYTCQGIWACCGETCYYFSEDMKTWDDSEASCRHLGSSLTKIGNRREKSIIQIQLTFRSWVGLRKKGSQLQWVHQKDTTLSSDLDFHENHLADAECGFLEPVGLSRRSLPACDFEELVKSQCLSFNGYQ
ncbi:NKG2-D type II integral membrane protein-like [Psammomys obesus]|uniref:NKG2-D type II integral membrane protein-like n=1 Tax=Psammomys obesus TaxID=48139 RepID=UPI002452F3EE|nr:NKG2-D type II integral membrane protein-like [Psammomys obesus]